MRNTMWFMILTLLFSCKGGKDQLENVANQLKDSGFDSEAWKTDSLGCSQAFKIKQAYILRENKKLFIGLNINKAIAILGTPYHATESSNTVSYEYIAEGEDLCNQIKDGSRNLSNRSSLDVFKLRVSFNKDDSAIYYLDVVMP